VTQKQLEEGGVCDANTIRGGEEFLTLIHLEKGGVCDANVIKGVESL
jgi:hypothetical protein